MKKIFILLSLLSTAILLTSSNKGDNSVKLRLNKGDEFTYINSIKTKSYTDEDMTEFLSDMEVTVKQTFTVNNITENKEFDMQVTLQAMKIKQKGGGFELDYDSENKEAKSDNPMQGMISQMMSGFLNKPFEFQLNEAAQVTKKLNITMPDGRDFGANLLSTFIELPNRELRKGDVWMAQSNVGGFKATSVYTVEAFQANLVQLAVEIIPEKKEDELPNPKGIIMLDASTGMVSKSAFTLNQKMFNPLMRGDAYSNVVFTNELQK